jgi:hypothetical protein
VFTCHRAFLGPFNRKWLRNTEEREKVLSEKALRVSKYVASRLVRVLAKDIFLNKDEDMENNLLLLSTRISERILHNMINKQASI